MHAKHPMRWLVCVSACGMLVATTYCQAKPLFIARYLSVTTKPLNAQQHPLQQRVHIRFPENIVTIGQAMQFLLQFRGYRLVAARHCAADVRALLAQPLPEVDRTLGPMPLLAALHTLAGNPFCLLVDPIHHLLSWQLKPAFRTLYHTH